METLTLSSPIVSQLLSLVRASLWQTTADPQLFTAGTTDWETIGTLALRQTVAILAIEGATTLPADHQPDKAWLRNACSYSLRNVRTHALLDSCVAEATALLQSAGLAPVLLKGQAYARYYPRPELRQCGDIDLYVGEDGYRHASEAAQRFGWESVEPFIPAAKHYGCCLHGIRIELHRTAALLPFPIANRRFQTWSHGQLSSALGHVKIGDREIATPSPLFDVIFVFLHLHHHFVSSGIGLRHLCDWVLLLHAHHKRIDQQELQRLLRSFHLLRAWRSFAPIAVRYLGLPEVECPLYSVKYAKKSDKLLAVILREGNFGHYSPRLSKKPRPYLLRKLHSLAFHSRRTFSLFPLEPATFTAHYCRCLYGGLRKVLKELTTKKQR